MTLTHVSWNLTSDLELRLFPWCASQNVLGFAVVTNNVKISVAVLASAAHIPKLERQRDLAWPLRKNDTQIREAFCRFFFIKACKKFVSERKIYPELKKKDKIK